jgi:hypothetical protein
VAAVGGVEHVIVLAHAGHVIVDMLYALPLVIMIGLLVVGRMREKRTRSTNQDPEV